MYLFGITELVLEETYHIILAICSLSLSSFQSIKSTLNQPQLFRNHTDITTMLTRAASNSIPMINVPLRNANLDALELLVPQQWPL